MMLLYVAGGLFHPADKKQEIAFHNAVDRINSDRTILPRSKLKAQIEQIPPQDSFHASKKGKNIKYGTVFGTGDALHSFPGILFFICRSSTAMYGFLIFYI